MFDKPKRFRKLAILLVVAIGLTGTVFLYLSVFRSQQSDPSKQAFKPTPLPPLKPLKPIIKLSKQQKQMLLALPLSRNYGPLTHTLFGSREKFDANGVVMVDYSKYGQGWNYNPEAVGRYAIRALTGFLDSGDERCLAIFQNSCDWLVLNLKQSKQGLWQWFYNFDYTVNDVYDLKKPWASAMAQGTAIAALARAHYLMGSQEYLDAIRKATGSFSVDVNKGGFRRTLADDAWWYEEYPTPKPSFVLNGFIVALLGLQEAEQMIPDNREFNPLIENGVRAVDMLLPEFSVKDEHGVIWSRYDLAVKMPVVLFRFRPRKKTEKTLRIDKIVLTSDKAAGTIDVGNAGDEDRQGSYVLYNPQYQMWGDRKQSGGVSYRNAFGNRGKYRHAPFMMQLIGRHDGRLLNVTYDAAFRGSCKVEVYDSEKYHLLGRLTGDGSRTGSWRTTSFPVPPGPLSKVHKKTSTFVNIAKSYHDDHIVLLYLLGESQGDEARYAPLINLWLDALKYIPTQKMSHLVKCWGDPNRRPKWVASFPPLGQIEEKYNIPPYSPNSAWCAGFARRFVLANPKRVNEFLWREKKTARTDFRKAYDGTLRMWLLKDLKNLSGDKFAKVLKDKIAESFEDCTPLLKRYYPRIPEKDLLLVHINNLVHGHYEFKTTYGQPKSAKSLLRQLTGDCSELGRAGAVLASLFRDDAKIFSFYVNYQVGKKRFQSSHCIFATKDYILDPLVNMVIRSDLKRILAIAPEKRFERLMDNGRIGLFHNRYLVPDARKKQIETHSTDGGVIIFYYPWYLRGFGLKDSKEMYLDIPRNLMFGKIRGKQ